MTNVHRAAEVRGKTIRFAWLDGPTKGKTHEHVFHDDGTVEWRDANAPQPAAQAVRASGDATAKPRVEYAAVKLADEVYLVSYRSNEGYTLTVALDFGDHRITGFASGAKDWHPVSGTFEVVE
jgi:hypothetical protein